MDPTQYGFISFMAKFWEAIIESFVLNEEFPFRLVLASFFKSDI